MVRWANISVFVITLNEIEHLPSALHSIPQAGEIIVVDGGSSDGTAEYARDMGCRVIIQPFRSFVEQKKVALSHARLPWVFNLDADEIISEELAKEIAEIPNNSPYTAFRIPLINFFCGKWVRHAGWYPDYKTRLVQRDSAVIRSRGRMVHESLSPRNGPIGTLKHSIYHRSIQNLTEFWSKINLYAELSAKDLCYLGYKSYFWHRYLLPVWAFMHTWVIRQGFRDGLPGWRIAQGAMLTTYRKYQLLKIYEKSVSNHTMPSQ